MNTQTAQVDELRLVALPSAINCTELFVRFSLTEWSLLVLTDEAIGAAQTLVRAVIANSSPAEPGFLVVRLRISDEHLTIEVEGDDNTHAQQAAPDLGRLNGGVVPLHGGTLIWCEVPLPTGLTGSAVQLPRRQRRSAAEEFSEQLSDGRDIDPAALERVLDGLKRHR